MEVAGVDGDQDARGEEPKNSRSDEEEPEEKRRERGAWTASDDDMWRSSEPVEKRGSSC